MRAFYRALRIFSGITLFFFCWTYLPLYAAVAYAATPQGKGTIKQSPAASDKSQERPEARFEKALEDIRQTAAKAGDKTNKGEDASAEIVAIRAKRAEIDSLDTDFKKEFPATEKKLKDAHLPNEILARHYKFVKHYEDNLKELRTNLDDVEQAKTKSDLKAKIEKVRLHLEKVKPPKMHKTLDPNNLPNRMVKGKKRSPRLKKEDFEKDFPQQKSLRTASNPQDFLSADLRRYMQISRSIDSTPQHKPVLLAFNQTASDISFTIPRPSGERSEMRGGIIPKSEINDLSQLALVDSTPFILAQMTGQPSADDLAETPDIQFTQDIINLATQLNNNPVQIYNWVRNNIEYAPTYGSIQGADQCLQSKICNDMDTASLLIALLRVSGIYAHYVYGTIQMPIDKAMNWVGGVTDPNMAGTVLATNGVPATALVSGSTIQYEQIEHVWVKAYIDYIPSRGAVQRQGNAWIPLDASYKQYNYTQGIDIASAVSFDGQTFMNQFLSTATTDTTFGSITNLNSAYVQQTMQDYQTRVNDYIQQNYPSATVGDVIGTKQIIQQNFPILLGTLPYKTVQVGSEFTAVSDNLRETIRFTIPDPTGATAGLSYTTSMAQIAGKKITLSFSPATDNDEAVLESLLPVPNPNGTPIDPSQLPLSLPAYLINFKPELRIEGQIVATGVPGTMGSDQAFTISLNEPGIGVSNINNVIKAGEYYGIGVDTGRISADRLNALKAKLETTKTKLEAQTFDGITKDDLMGDILSTVIACYFAELDVADEIAARTSNIVRYRIPSVGMFSMALNVTDAFGIPISAGPKGMVMDVDRIMQAVFSKDGGLDKVKQYMLSSGSNSSALEHDVPEQLFSTPTNDVQGVSAVTALRLANDQGIPIYVINQSNINSIFPLLGVNEDVKSDIQNAVNTGKIVTVQQSNITYNGWTGCGYIIIDPNTGAGAYMISNGLNGSCFWYYFWTVMWILAIIALTIAIGMLVGAFAPEIAATTAAFDDAVTSFISAIGVLFASLYSNVSDKYLDYSLQLADLFQKVKWSAAFYDASVFYAQHSPPPWPIPTDPTGGAYYIMVYMCFIYLKYIKQSEHLTNYWRLAQNAEIILSGFYDEYIKTMNVQPSLILGKELHCCA